MKIDSFDLNKKYVFDRDMYLADEKQDESITAKEMYDFNENVRNWVDNLHGKEVTLISEVLGTVSMYKDVFISANWCKELTE